ncbi:MAG: hypothetical protein ACJ746_25000 [Bryobacteraceae bacterium]
MIDRVVIEAFASLQGKGCSYPPLERFLSHIRNRFPYERMANFQVA